MICRPLSFGACAHRPFDMEQKRHPTVTNIIGKTKTAVRDVFFSSAKFTNKLSQFAHSVDKLLLPFVFVKVWKLQVAIHTSP